MEETYFQQRKILVGTRKIRNLGSTKLGFMEDFRAEIGVTEFRRKLISTVTKINRNKNSRSSLRFQMKKIEEKTMEKHLDP